MANELKMANVEAILHLHALKWSARRIALELGINQSPSDSVIASFDEVFKVWSPTRCRKQFLIVQWTAGAENRPKRRPASCRRTHGSSTKPGPATERRQPNDRKLYGFVFRGHTFSSASCAADARCKPQEKMSEKFFNREK